jgi:hypothetical protein
MSEENIPLQLEPLRGWRHWRVELDATGEPYLQGAFGYPWIVHQSEPTTFTAICLRWGAPQGALTMLPSFRLSLAPLFGTHNDHKRIPAENCGCGFYIRKPDDNPARWRANFPHGYLCVEGEVEIFGRILIAEQGYRAEKARILGPLYVENICTGVWKVEPHQNLPAAVTFDRLDYYCPLPPVQFQYSLGTVGSTTYNLCEIHLRILQHFQTLLQKLQNEETPVPAFNTVRSVIRWVLEEAPLPPVEAVLPPPSGVLPRDVEKPVEGVRMYPLLAGMFFNNAWASWHKPPFNPASTLRTVEAPYRTMTEKLGGRYGVPVIPVSYEQLTKTGRLPEERVMVNLTIQNKGGTHGHR